MRERIARGPLAMAPVCEEQWDEDGEEEEEKLDDGIALSSEERV